MLIVGTSDRERKFHPFGLCLSYSEQEHDFEFMFSSSSKLQSKALTQEDSGIYGIRKYNSWKTFEEFTNSRFSLWCLEMNLVDWESAICDCPVFLKQYQCKHALGLAIRSKLVVPPAEAKQIPLGLKRKPGRPKKAKAALLFQ